MAQNISIGTSDNAGDGQSLREAFRRVRKNFAEIYGDTDSANLTDTETLPTGTFVESVQDIVGGMLTGNTENNITVTYQDSDGTIDFDVAADITDVNAGSGLTGTGESGGAATLNVGAGTGITVNADDVELNLNDLGAAVVDVANDSIAIIDSSASNASKKETIADFVAAIAGTNLTATNGVLSASGGADTVRTVTAGGNTLDDSETLAFTAGTAVDISESAGAVTIGVDVSDFMTNGSNNRVLTATGTDAMNAEANLVFDGSNLGLNVTSPSSYAFNGSALVVNNSSGYGIVSIVSDVNKTGYLSFADGTTGSDRYRGSIEYGHTNDIMQFRSAGSINMVLDSTGQLGIGTTSPDYALDVAGDIGIDANLIHNGDSDTYINFGTDAINFYAGNARMLTLSEGGTDEVVINQNSADIDFRVESNNKTKALFVNGGTDHVQASAGVQTITTTSGTINLDSSSYGVFRLTSDLTGATTLNIQNMQEGQVIDITVSGSQTITFSSDDTTETFNKVGGVDYDGASDNHIQVVCIDDTDSAAIYHYSIGTYTSDTTP
jgi:hypothetical protein